MSVTPPGTPSRTADPPPPPRALPARPCPSDDTAHRLCSSLIIVNGQTVARKCRIVSAAAARRLAFESPRAANSVSRPKKAPSDRYCYYLVCYIRHSRAIVFCRFGAVPEIRKIRQRFLFVFCDFLCFLLSANITSLATYAFRRSYRETHSHRVLKSLTTVRLCYDQPSLGPSRPDKGCS